MIKRTDEIPIVLTCFAYNAEYFAEMDGMLASIREHHPNWVIVVGRGPIEGHTPETLEVEWPGGKRLWSLPVPFGFDDNREDNWSKICLMKAWWIAQVWHNFGELADDASRRVLWLDADARLGGPIDIELDPEAEVLAGPWYYDPENSAYDGIRCGIVLFQGAKGGKVESILDQWSAECLRQIQDLPKTDLPWLYGDGEVLRELLKSLPDTSGDYTMLRLEHSKYCGHITKYGSSRPGTLVIHWLMSAKFWMPEDSAQPWPPPEDYRRQVAAESLVQQAQNRTDGSTK